MNNMSNILLNLVIFGFIIGIEVIMPKLTRKDIVFSIRVPIEVLDDPRIKKIIDSYRKNLIIATVPIALFISFMVNGDTRPGIYIIGVFSVIGLSIVYFLKSRKQIKELKEEEQWTFKKRQVTIVETKKSEESSIFTIFAFIISGLIVLGNGIYAKVNYSQFPSEIPYHWNIQGIGTQSIPKSEFSVFLVPGMQLFIFIIMFVAYKSIDLTKVQLDVEDPNESKVRNNIFKKRWTAAVISIMFLLLSLFSLYNFDTGGTINISPEAYTFINIVFLVLIFIIAGITAITTGQGGSRLKNETIETVKEMNRDDDQFWKFGMIYYNKNDPSIFIEKRFGVGFTMNFANPIAIVLLVGLFVLIGIFALLPSILS